MFILRLTTTFISSKEKVVKTNQILNKRLKITLQKLTVDPTHSSLKSHKVNTPDYGIRWSSWITGDLRIIWDYDDNQRLIIILLAIGGHSGTHKVYK